MVGKTDLRCDNVADLVYLVTEDFAVRSPETIDFCGERNAHIPVVDIIESADSIGDFFLVVHIPMLRLFDERGLVSDGERGVDTQIAEGCKTGLNRDRVPHVILPVFGETGMQQFTLLGPDTVVERTGITQIDLLVPSFLTSSLPTFERIESGQRDAHIREGHLDDGVTHILRQIDLRTQRQSDAGKSGTPVDRRSTGGLSQSLWVVHRREIVFLKTFRGVVHASRQRVVGIGLRILRVTPLYLETGLLLVVWHILLSSDSALEICIERAAVLIAFPVVRRCREAP